MFALFNKDDDDEAFEGMYENGHWEWSQTEKRIVFICDFDRSTSEEADFFIASYGGSVPFKDNVEPIEQQRFRKRYQRKIPPGEVECITLQDVKDVALFTAPLSVMSDMVINILHLPVTERFIRAIILYSQYYLQVKDERAKRDYGNRNKIPSQKSLAIEKEYHDNLEDLRLMVAKEYCTFIIAGDGLKKIHHMGPSKRLRSLSKTDAHIFESLIRFIVQITWLALGRKCFREIDLEVNRIFKSEIYNSIEHRLKAKDYSSLSCRERRLMLGQCLRMDRKLNSLSPLMNEVNCKRHVDYRMFALGVSEFPRLSPRMLFFELALSAPEERFQDFKITLGIIGLPRSKFDSMLHDLVYVLEKSHMGTSSSLHSRSSIARRRSPRVSTNKLNEKLYPDILLPKKDNEQDERLHEEFPKKLLSPRPCSLSQQKCWLARLAAVKGRRSRKPSLKKTTPESLKS